jgi:hypothetical protein
VDTLHEDQHIIVHVSVDTYLSEQKSFETEAAEINEVTFEYHFIYHYSQFSLLIIIFTNTNIFMPVHCSLHQGVF